MKLVGVKKENEGSPRMEVDCRCDVADSRKLNSFLSDEPGFLYYRCGIDASKHDCLIRLVGT